VLRERGFSMRAILHGASFAQTKLKKWLALLREVAIPPKKGADRSQRPT
jgi:hypothetical protein